MEDGNQAVGEWLQAQQIADKPRLLEQMQVDEGWQLAVETVLGDYLQAVCVDDIGQLGNMLGSLEQGQLLLLEGATEQTPSTEFLASRVRSAGRAGALLTGVRAAEDLNEAMVQRASLAPHESIITRDGVWLGPNWLRVTRLTDQHGGVIQRQQELETLSTRLEAEQQREEQLEQAQLQSAGSAQTLRGAASGCPA